MAGDISAGPRYQSWIGSRQPSACRRTVKQTQALVK
jgi:hypothetical protein